MPTWYVTIYEPDGRAWTEGGFGDDLTAARKFARKNTHPRGRCSIHTGNPEHGRLYAKLCGNLVDAA